MGQQMRSFRNFLLYDFVLMLCILNFALSAKQRKLWNREDKIEKMEEKHRRR